MVDADRRLHLDLAVRPRKSAEAIVGHGADPARHDQRAARDILRLHSRRKDGQGKQRAATRLGRETHRGLHLETGSAASVAACPLPSGRRTSKRSEEHTSELQSLMRISYAVFCLKKKTHTIQSERRRSP